MFFLERGPRLLRKFRHRLRETSRQHNVAELTPHQRFTLMLIGQMKATNIKPLAQASDESCLSISAMVKRLVCKGFAKRTVDDSDRRRIIVRLSELGRDFLPEVEVLFMAALAEITRTIEGVRKKHPSAVSPKHGRHLRHVDE